jgi:inhibitor of KinA
LQLQEAFSENNFTGFVEKVPAYSSLAVFYDPALVRENNKTNELAFSVVKNLTEKIIDGLPELSQPKNKREIIVPVYYNGEDLETVAKINRLTIDEVIQIHTGNSYHVFMIGFQPGFAYMGKLDEKIATPRLASPRTKVPAGSVGIAGSQTGIYPFASPGGWQLIGQTPLKIFDIKKDDPCLFKPGDEVKFISINKTEFDKINEY